MKNQLLEIRNKYGEMTIAVNYSIKHPDLFRGIRNKSFKWASLNKNELHPIVDILLECNSPFVLYAFESYQCHMYICKNGNIEKYVSDSNLISYIDSVLISDNNTLVNLIEII